MKDFTTSEHITPILAEIIRKYLKYTGEASRNYFKCNLILTHPTTRNAYPVRAGKDFYIPDLENYKKVCEAIQEYTTAAETTPGELDNWQAAEEKRVFLAVRDALIKKYSQI